MPEGLRRWTILEQTVDELIAHARESSPVECCGVLIGSPGRILHARRARNLADNPNRFLIDPQDHLGARRESRILGLDVVGFYHSHPHSPAVPSPTDLAEAWHDDHCHVIVSLASEPPGTRLYELREGQFVAGPLDVVAGSGGAAD